MVVNSLTKLLPEHALKGAIPAASPLFPTRFRILDQQKNRVPLGTVGQLYIGGPTVARGYVNLGEITAQVFSEDSDATAEKRQAERGRVYATGD
jgi:non-ribosomal peptide synthetase component F